MFDNEPGDETSTQSHTPTSGKRKGLPKGSSFQNSFFKDVTSLVNSSRKDFSLGGGGVFFHFSFSVKTERL